MKEIPLYENQEGYWRDLERIEALWKIPNIDSPDCEFNDSENYLNFPPETPTTPVFRSVDDLNCSDSQVTPPDVLHPKNENLSVILTKIEEIGSREKLDKQNETILKRKKLL